MFLAWLIILAHSIIPHIHQDEITGIHNIVCKADPDNHAWNGKSEIKKAPEDESVCHISGLLFSQLSHDNLLFHYDKVYQVYPVSISGYISRHIENIFIAELFYDTVSLRAPPAA